MDKEIKNTPTCDTCQSCYPNVKIDKIEEGMTGKEVADLLYNNFDKLNKSKANKCVERKVRHLLRGENGIYNETAKNKFIQQVFYTWSKKDYNSTIDYVLNNAPSIEVGTTTTLPAGSQATVTATKDGRDAVLNFGIPKGDKGDKGIKGDSGVQLGDIVLSQELGNDEDTVISQKTVTDELRKINSNTGIDEYPAFSDQTAYSTGDVVNYQGKLYQFTTDHATGAWTGTDVEETSFKKDIENSTNKFVFTDRTISNEVIKELYIQEDKINIEDCILRINNSDGNINTVIRNSSSVDIALFHKIEGNLYSILHNDDEVYGYAVIATINADTTAHINQNAYDIKKSPFIYAYLNITNLFSIQNDLIQKVDNSVEQTNKLLSDDGTISDLHGSSIRKFDALPNTTYVIFGDINSDRAVCFYNDEDNYISGISGNILNPNNNGVCIICSPNNTAYIRFCALNYSTATSVRTYKVNTTNSLQIQHIISELQNNLDEIAKDVRGEYTTLEKPLTQTGYYGTKQTIGQELAGETSSNGHKSGAIDISNYVRIRITGFITTSARCTVITDKNNIVLQFSRENQGETAEFVRGDEDWKYLYCSSQFNTVTIYLYTSEGLVNKVVAVGKEVSSLKDELAEKSIYNITKETLDLVVSESGNFLNYQNGNIQANSSYSPKVYTNIKVVPNSTVSLHLESCPMAGQRGFAFYDISGTYISGEAYVVGTLDYEVTVPNDAYFMGITVFNDGDFNIAVTDISIDNVVSGLVDSTKSLLETEKKFNELTNIEFIIPSKVTGTIGHNTNINLDNVIPENGTTEKAQIFRYSGGDSYDGDVEIIPEEEGTNDYVIGYMPSTSYGIKDQDLPLVVVSDAIGNGLTKKVMVIGESTTDNNYVIKHLHDLFEEDVMNITLLGTRQDSEGNHHEGRGGWTTRNYLEDESVNDVSNAFYNPEIEGFDFSYYLTHNSIDTPDIVIFNMGLNDLDIGGGALTTNNLTTMINQIKAANNNVIIIVALPNLPTALKQTWGYSSNRRYRLLINTIKPLIEVFDDRENENIFISPVYLYLHPKWDMPYEMKYVNSEHNESNNGMKIPVAVSPAPTHPSQIGYYKMADCYYNTIKYAVSKVQ